MTIDRRLIDISMTADEREPTHVYKDQMAVIVDNLIFGYFRDPKKTDFMLRRDGLGLATDQLEKVFGAKWWEQL